VTTTGGTLLAAPGAQLLETSFSSTGRLANEVLTLSGSGVYNRSHPAARGRNARLDCSSTLQSTLMRVQFPAPPNGEFATQRVKVITGSTPRNPPEIR
jgi:hypothetical protein